MEVSLCNRIIFLIVILGSLSSLGLSQNKQDYHWVMGYNGQNPHPDLGGTDWVFENDSLRLIKVTREANFYLSDVSISDKKGGGLYYSNGCNIYDSNHNSLINSQIINQSNLKDFWCPDEGYPADQSGAFLNFNDSNSTFYINQTITYNPGHNVLVGANKLGLYKVDTDLHFLIKPDTEFS